MQGELVASLADIPQVIIFYDTVSELKVTRESLKLRLAKAGLLKINKSQRVIEVFHHRISTARKEELRSPTLKATSGYYVPQKHLLLELTFLPSNMLLYTG